MELHEGKYDDKHSVAATGYPLGEEDGATVSFVLTMTRVGGMVATETALLATSLDAEVVGPEAAAELAESMSEAIAEVTAARAELGLDL